MASDHADPISDANPQQNLTGLFVFPHDDNMIVVLGTVRGLTNAPPYDLDSHSYSILMSLNSKVKYDNKADLARYGGTLVNHDEIDPDVTIELKLNNDATLKEKSIKGIDTSGIKIWTGLRDDPFIFPRFFGTNVIAMVLSIPMSAFPSEQKDWVVWATAHEGSDQYDHVGRSLRTMLPRFDFLNTLPPKEHVAAIRKRMESPNLLTNIAQVEVEPLFALRPYDLVADVMIFTTRYPPGFPNGRQLTDDVAALTCEQGDCLLYELSFADSTDYPRKTTNDKPFLDEFPYLAEPWPAREPDPQPSLTTGNKVLLRILIVLAIAFLVCPWVLAYVYRKRLKKLTTPEPSDGDTANETTDRDPTVDPPKESAAPE